MSGFYRLSPTSSYRRFLSASPVLTDQMVHVLTDVDHRDHEAMIALDEHGERGSASRIMSAASSIQASRRWR